MFVTMMLTAMLMAGGPQQPPSATAKSTVGPSLTTGGEAKNVDKGDRSTSAADAPAVTRHRLTVEGREVTYTATAGRLPVLNDLGEAEAQIFFVAYTVDNPSLRVKRPLLFIFNGGPGASSVWLHLGAAGPRRVQMLADGSMPPPPYQLVDNEATWLDRADLVFIDPVGTGYSRALKPELTAKFTSVQGDIDSMGRFIRLYLGRYGRWGAPLFLVGESYGGFRAAGLSQYLLAHGIALNGIMLVSPAMNMQTLSFDQGNDLPYALFLPSYAATAWYHHRLKPSLQADLDKTLVEAESWAETEYTTALAMGDRLSPERRRAVVEKLAEFTGMDAAFIDNRNLRIDNRTFARELLRDRRQITGYMDSRFTAATPDPTGRNGFDPTVAVIRPPYTTAFNRYVRAELGYECDQEYFVLGGGIGKWDWEAKNGYADTSENLRNSLTKNPYMKLFVAVGLFDLATPHFSTYYTIGHLGLVPPLQKNISIRRYRSGHMMYLQNESLLQLKRDVAEFMGNSLTDR